MTKLRKTIPFLHIGAILRTLRKESLNQYRLLIIDDLGVERNTLYALETVYLVVFSGKITRQTKAGKTGECFRYLKGMKQHEML